MIIKQRDINVGIDIVLLTHNNINNTIESIKCLYTNTKNFGLIIIDNNSQDGTKDYINKLLEQHNNITAVFNSENIGIINGRNMGYDIFKTLPNPPAIIGFIDNDQFVQKGWLEKYKELLVEADMVGIEAWQMRKDFFPCKKVTSSSMPYNYVGCGGMVIKKEVIEDVGLFDERYNPMYWEDPDFCWTAHDAGYTVKWCSSPMIFHKPHQLLDKERKKYFMASWKQFQNKWKGRELTVFNPLK